MEQGIEPIFDGQSCVSSSDKEMFSAEDEAEVSQRCCVLKKTKPPASKLLNSLLNRAGFHPGFYSSMFDV